MSEQILEGRVAVVTGASRGIGKAIALALGAAGAKLALVGRDLEQLNQTAAAARESGAEAEVYQADVVKEAEILGLEKAVSAKFGKVHILVNNAGMNIRKPITDFTLEEWHRVLDTNLTSAFLMSRSFVPQMKGNGYGRILNLTSPMSWVSIPHRGAYSASKAGLLGLTRCLALELAPDKITVVAISPGPIATEMNAQHINNPETNQWFVSRVPLGRWGTVNEVGKLALFLCSEDAGFITGTDILVDGGWCAQ
jgi:NAD(P)-dependent dehydrogenase (short-subunit alcohol dehydrogenase family)